MADDDVEASLVEQLATLDERLRQGQMNTEEMEAELAALATDAELADLINCVKVLENRWPRGLTAAKTPAAANAAAALHPALSLALANGQEEPRFGKFLIKSELGRGGFGVVFLAEDTVLGRDVALKLPRSELLLDEAAKRRFLQEARATAAIEHPNVAAMYEAGEIGSLCYLAAAYCPGETLGQWLARREQPPPPRLAARLIEVLALALHHIHEQGILHRDLKPGNVLLWPAVEGAGADELPFVPKLTDFGLSKVLAESLVESRSSVLMGTPLYMAPEQALGLSEQVGTAADVYSLGVILYELLCQQLPFVGTTPLEVLDQVRNAEPPPICIRRKGVPRDLETICLKCLQKRAGDRYVSAQALAHDLRRFLDGESIVARPVSVGRRLLRWCQHPQRIRETGLTVMGVNMIIPAGMVMSLLMVQAGNVIQRPADFSLAEWYPALLTTVLSSHGPLVIVGWLVKAGYEWATVVSLLAGAAMTVAAILFMTGHIPMGTTGWDTVPGFRILYPLIIPLVLLQTLMSTIALLAIWHAKRERQR